MRKIVALSIALFLAPMAGAFAAQYQERPTSAEMRAPRQDLVKMPAFLFCPHKEQAGSWSLYVIVDRNDPSRALAVGLEELPGKNSRELKYSGVLAAQKDPMCPRRMISQLNCRDFASSSLEVKENNMLSIKINETQEGLALTVDARVSVDGRFVVGGPEQNRRSLMLQFNPALNCWQTKAHRLENTAGQNVAGNYGLTLTGIVFSAGATSISRIAAVDPTGRAIILMDR
ncbi:MAG: hypothetical protein WCT04_01820 [Planctomycetota bacterium]